MSDDIKNNFLTKRKLIISISAIVFLLFLITFFSDYGILQRILLENKKQFLNSEIKKQYLIKDSLKKELYIIKNDSLAIERIAREKFGMIKPGEKIFFIE